MAFKIIRDVNNRHQTGREIVAVLDSDADLYDLGVNFAPGSTAIVAQQGGNTYVTNASGEWTALGRESGSSGGSGLPAGAKPNQYIVTDGDGNAKWEDKLCWSEEGKVTLVELFQDSYSKLNPNRNSISIALEEGKSYTVKWDYDEYDCTCFVAYIDDVGSVLGIGNASLMGLGADTNEPFLICVLGSETLVKAQTGGLHELSISGIGEIIHKISGKCVEGMGWREDDTVITWDGNTDGLVSTPGAGDTVIYLVSDFIPAGDYKETIHTTFSHGYEADAPLLAAEDGLLVYGDGEVFFALRDNVTSNGITFPNAGTYFCIMPVYDDAGNSEQVYPTEIRVGGAIHPIDKKYLPNGADYYMYNGKAYHDIEHNNAVTKEEAVNAFNSGGIRLRFHDNPDMTYVIIAIDSSMDWATLLYVLPNMELDCRCELTACNTVEFGGVS